MTVRRCSHKVRGVQAQGTSGVMLGTWRHCPASPWRVTREIEQETLSQSDGTTCREAADTLLPVRPPRTLYTATAAGNAGNPYSTVQSHCTKIGRWQVQFQRWNILRDNPSAFSQLDIHSTVNTDTGHSLFNFH